MANIPKIYCFSNVVGGGEGVALAIAEDGTHLASHFCSHECFVPHDLGATSEWKHELYRRHYPDGFSVEFIASCDIDAHDGLKKAMSLNCKMAVDNDRPGVGCDEKVRQK